MANQTKIGRYVVVSTLGQGAMGTVYKAVDPLIERTVAIKTINLNLSKDERVEFEERFYREAKSAGRLSHANIVTIYDVGETDDIAYIAMEYLEGESLREMLDSGVVLPVERISKIAARIASALSYAHENRVVHRDIKPANIMITPNRDVKIMDFGIAQISTGSRTQVGTVLGSPKYMAPEQVAGQPADGRTDIFALGVVLYEMLTGATPFNGDNLGAIMYKVLNEEPAPPSTLNARVPPVFDRIIGRALSKRPEDRYQTAREFARDLRNYETCVPQDAPRAAPAVQTSRTAAGQHDATTLLLPPRKARDAMASVAGAQKGTAARQGNALSRGKLSLLALPVVAVAAFALFLQGRPPQATVAAPVAQAVEKTPVDPPQPAAAPARAVAAPVPAPRIPAPVVASAPPAKAPAPVEPAKSTVLFAVSPWGQVFVDGESVGVSPPLTQLELAPGSHTVEIRNQEFAPYRDTVHLASGQSLKIRHKFK